MRAGWLFVALCACGRVDFGDARDAGGMPLVVDAPAPRTDAPPADPSLVAHYAMDGLVTGTTLLDDSGYGNRGACLSADCPTVTAGHLGNALAFDGTAAEIAVPSSPSLTTASALTVATWFDSAPIADTTTRCFLSKPVGTTSEDTWQLCVDGNTNLYAEMQPMGATSVQLFSPTKVSTTAWHFAALTWDGATATLYLDGPAVDSADVPSVLFDTHAVLVGADSDNDAFTAGFHGAIDEVSIYNRALSAAELAELATS